MIDELVAKMDIKYDNLGRPSRVILVKIQCGL